MMQTKRCSGYKGHWECEDEYPDHIVPKDMFTSNAVKCRACDIYCAANRPKHPATGELKRNWKHRIASTLAISTAGLKQLTRSELRSMRTWQSYLDKAEEQWHKEVTEWKINDKVVDTAHRSKSEFGQSTPMTKRETTVVEGEQVPEGWVYVVYNPDVPSVLKIGKTFPDGIPSIMSSARRFGRAELADKFWFDEAYKAEQAIHTVLSGCNLRALGYSDCGVELFKCNLNDVKGAIENAIR